MRSFKGKRLDTILVVNLERGELLLESICRSLEDAGIKNAVILSAIGSLQKVVFHRVTGFEKTPSDEFLTLEKPMEISSLQGIVLDGKPHIHMVFSDCENTYTGHLENGTEVLYLVEMTLAEIDGLEVVRLINENNIAYFTEK